MRVEIQFDMDNAAFEDPLEVVRVLERAVIKIKGQAERASGQPEVDQLRDSNGNVVGWVRWMP